MIEGERAAKWAAGAGRKKVLGAGAAFKTATSPEIIRFKRRTTRPGTETNVAMEAGAR